jgi:hypothetical protein
METQNKEDGSQQARSQKQVVRSKKSEGRNQKQQDRSSKTKGKKRPRTCVLLATLALPALYHRGGQTRQRADEG